MEPLIRNFFRLVVRNVGPKVTKGHWYEITDVQGVVVGELESLVKRHSRRFDILEAFRHALPKSIYWLGTALLIHETVDLFWPSAVAGSPNAPLLERQIRDPVFAAAVRFMHRRYLAGQAVFATTLQEKSWIGRSLPLHVEATDLLPCLVRILRAIPGATIKLQDLLEIDIGLSMDLRKRGSAAHTAAMHKLDELWRMLVDVGAGQVHMDVLGQKVLRKFRRDGMTQLSLEWMQQNRIPGYMFGVAARPNSTEPRVGSTALRNTHPSRTVQGSAVVKVSPTQPHSPLQLALSTALTPQDAESEEPTPALATRTAKPALVQYLDTEIAPGIGYSQGEARERLRQLLKDRDISTVVCDVKPIRHDRYWRYKAVCQRCQPGTTAVVYKGIYFRRDAGAPARTLTLAQHGVHDHDADVPLQASRIFTPKQEAAAQEYLRSGHDLSAGGLEMFLLAQGCTMTSLPSRMQRSTWLRNHKYQNKNQKASLVAETPCSEVLQRTIAEWPNDEPSAVSDLFLLLSPESYIISDTSVCVPFSCRGMVNIMRRYADTDVAVIVDAKQNCFKDGYSIITSSILCRDKLRNTTLLRSAAGRVQAKLFTSHAAPTVQAVINVEDTDHVLRVFQAMCRLWDMAVPGRRPFKECVRQVQKDFLPAIEAARCRVFPNARPVDDFFHFMEKQGTIEKKLKNLAPVGKREKKFKKRDFGWVIASLHTLRHSPVIDLFSALFTGFVKRLQGQGEEVLAEYLGSAPYATKVSVQILREQWGLHVNEPTPTTDLLFAGWWSGLLGIMPGTDSGSNAKEAFHSLWAKQLGPLAGHSPVSDAFNVMQRLYSDKWQLQLDWHATEPLCVQPPSDTLHFLAGDLLHRCGRSTATDFAEAARSGRVVHQVLDISESLQIVAMCFRVAETNTLDIDAAQHGARLLFLHSADLRTELLQCGLLDRQGWFQLTATKKLFDDIVYVLAKPAWHVPHANYAGPLCTCPCFCRFAACEHAEYAKMLSLRVRTATLSADSIPAAKKRGRKPGQAIGRKDIVHMAKPPVQKRRVKQ